MDKLVRRAVIGCGLLIGLADPAAAHAGSLRLSGETTAIPTWVVILTGGGIIAASFLLASLITDHETITALNSRSRSLPAPIGVGESLVSVVRWGSVLVLIGVITLGLIGPVEPTHNFAMLVVWAGWWAGYTMSIYLVGNSWPVVNPWRTLARYLPQQRATGDLQRFGPWPSVIGLLGLVWLEVVSPVAENPRLLSGVVILYSIITLTGAGMYGAGPWFRRIDPITRVFRCYGRVAPVQRTDEGLQLVRPTTALTRAAEATATPFVIALLWSTTFDGLVSTPAWAALAETLVGVGVPPLVVYLAAIVAGYGVFLGAYRVASMAARRTAGTYLATATIADRFVPSLLPIAAGYHLAHFLGYFLSLSPALVAITVAPLGTAAVVEPFVLPGWFGVVELVFVILGHLFAIWIAHSISFELFTGRLQPIRSQYPFIVVMVAYTMTSMVIVTQPAIAPPYV